MKQVNRKNKLLVNSFAIYLFILGVVILTSVSVKAQTGKNGELRMTPSEIAAAKPGASNVPGSSNYSAVQEIVIHGDPSRAGLYTIILKIAGNTRIAAHLHPDSRMATVISGTWYFGYGDKFDETKLKQLPVGSVYAEVGGQNHFAMTKGPVMVEITGYGPSGVTYVNPADDPKHKK
ncbi:cupin domain-containing protein [Flavitalea flava]